MLPPRLERELESLCESYPIEIVEEDGIINVMIARFPTSALYSQPETLLLLRVPRSYPDASLDMFWTDPSLILADGRVPQCGDLIEQYAGRSWRRFSWHHSGWSQQMQALAAYLDFVRRRFHVA